MLIDIKEESEILNGYSEYRGLKVDVSGKIGKIQLYNFKTDFITIFYNFSQNQKNSTEIFSEQGRFSTQIDGQVCLIDE